MLWVSSAFDRGQHGDVITFIMRIDENWHYLFYYRCGATDKACLWVRAVFCLMRYCLPRIEVQVVISSVVTCWHITDIDELGRPYCWVSFLNPS
jgi:hypothetical protein